MPQINWAEIDSFTFTVCTSQNNPESANGHVDSTTSVCSFGWHQTGLFISSPFSTLVQSHLKVVLFFPGTPWPERKKGNCWLLKGTNTKGHTVCWRCCSNGKWTGVIALVALFTMAAILALVLSPPLSEFTVHYPICQFFEHLEY